MITVIISKLTEMFFTKVTTLRAAISYISGLQSLLADCEAGLVDPSQFQVKKGVKMSFQKSGFVTRQGVPTHPSMSQMSLFEPFSNSDSSHCNVVIFTFHLSRMKKKMRS